MSATSLGKIMDALVSNGTSVNTNNECNNADDDDEKPLTEQSEIVMQNNQITELTNPTTNNQIIYETNDDSTTEPDDGIDEDSLSGQETGQASPNLQESGGFIKNNLTLNLNEILTDEKGVPKNKKFLESSEDQIINQIFFQTITITPTTDEDFIDSKFLNKALNNNLKKVVTGSEEDEPEVEPDGEAEGSVDFFSKKIEEDIEDTTYTDTADNYQENEANLCSLNDNFNENYCSFSSIDYQAQTGSAEKNSGSEDAVDDEDVLLAEHLKHQRPSIIIDCYDDDIKNDEEDDENGTENEEAKEATTNDENEEEAVVDVNADVGETADEEGEEKVNNYCFYFDQTIEEDDEEVNDDVVYVNGNDIKLDSDVPGDCLDGQENEPDIEINCSNDEIEIEHIQTHETETEDVDEIEGDEDCLEINIQNDEERELEDCGVINENCVSVHSAIESFESSESTVVKKSTKKVKSSKMTSKKTISTETTSSITSSKEESFENSLSTNSGSVDAVEKQQQAQVSVKTVASVQTNVEHHEEEDHVQHVATADDEQQEKATSDNKKLTKEGSQKKKSKKSKKSSESEKENISVCRSYGDLTDLKNHEDDSDESPMQHFNQVYRTKSFGDLRKFEQLPIYTGISVSQLRASYCSLVGLTDSNNIQHQSLSKNNCYKDKIKLGIMQFDMKSSFSKFDALQKKNLQNLQNGKAGSEATNLNAEKICHACGKVVFQMEQIKAEKKFWHKNCFRCSECNKQLNVDTYQSNESVLYCKPHFKTLFAPKAVENNNEPERPKRPEMIIRENQPVELPPDVVRSSDKTDLGLEELSQLNVRSRFQVFENAGQEEKKVELDRSPSGVKKSTSILSKLARFQAKGMDIGVVDDSLNGVCYEHSSSEEEEEDDEEYDDDENNEDIELIRAKRAQREKPKRLANMNELRKNFESGQLSKEERREERKQELQNIRSRLFMGKQAKIKEMYQQAVAESEITITNASKHVQDVEISDKARALKDKFERGEVFNIEDEENFKSLDPEELAVFERGLSKKSRSLFLELDATAAKSPNIQQSPSTTTVGLTRSTSRVNSQNTPSAAGDIVRSDSKVEDVKIETADISNKFKFFETYRPSEKEKKKFRITPPRDGVCKLPSPEKEVYRDPMIARSDARTETDEVLELATKTRSASKMLSMFRQMEEQKEDVPRGPKPLKRFTPPPDDNRRIYTPNSDEERDYTDDEEESDEECEEEESDEENPDNVKLTLKNEEEFLKAAISAERAKHLKDKFEKWEKNEVEKEINNSSSVNLYDPNIDESQVESAKSLRARFEQMKDQAEPKVPQARIKVNRFV